MYGKFYRSNNIDIFMYSVVWGIVSYYFLKHLIFLKIFESYLTS